MLRNKIQFLLAISILLSLVGVSEARMPTVALLPLADTTIDYNGVDLDTTAILEQFLAEAGLTLSDDLSLRHFMAVNHLRRSGSIDAFTVRKLGRETGVDFVLMGTICENGALERKRFGLIMAAFETVNGDIVCSFQDSSSLLQETTLLGIGAPINGEELKFMLLQRAARKVVQALPLLVEKAPRNSGRFKLVDLQLEPLYLRGGEPIKCRLKLQSLDKMPDRVELTNGVDKVELKAAESAGEYYGSWIAPATDGDYRVGLAFYDDSGQSPVIMPDCSIYKVVNQAPQLELELKQGFVFNDITVFHEQLMIVSRLQPVRPVSRWQVKVLQKDGSVLVNDRMDGDLPHNLLWRGCNSQRQRLPDGEYRLSLTLWDAAGNRVAATKKIALQSECQPVEVGIVRKQEKNYIRLSTPQDATFVLDMYWKLKVSSPAGELLMEKSGSTLPTELELPPDLHVDFLFYSINVRDQIDNTYVVADNRISMPEAKRGRSKGEEWRRDF